MAAANPVNPHPAETLLNQFKGFYEDLSVQKVDRLVELYTPDISFADPLSQVQGLLGLKRHLKAQLRGVAYCRFSYGHYLLSENTAFIKWDMRYSHPKLQGGKEIVVPGISELHFTQRIYYQCDSYDMGALLYEHAPIIGSGVKWLKSRIK